MDFGQEEAEILAEFAGLEMVHIDGGYVSVSHPKFDGEHALFQPWLSVVEQWQIQSLKDAVWERGLEDKFCWELLYELGVNEEKRFLYSDIVDVASAPPEAICEAILSIIGGDCDG